MITCLHIFAASRGGIEVEQALRDLVNGLGKMGVFVTPESETFQVSNLQNNKPVSGETSKVADSKTAKAGCFSGEDLVEFYNYSVISLELLYEAAEEGSLDAAEFLHDQTDVLMMKAGDVT